MNFFDAKFDVNGITLGRVLLPLPKDIADRAKENGSPPKKFGIGPEHFCPAECPEYLSILPTATKPFGQHTIVLVNINGVKSSTQIGSYEPVHFEQPISLSINMKEVHLFNASTGDWI